MDKANLKKLMQRITAFILAWLFIFNCSDVSMLKGIVRLESTEAAGDLTTDEIKNLWVKQKQNLPDWFTNTETYDTTDTINNSSFWKNTANFDVVHINTNAVDIAEKDDTDTSLGRRIESSYEELMSNPDALVVDDKIGDYNSTGGNIYNGDKNVDTENLYYTIEHSNALDGDYRVYYISTARQLAAVIKDYRSAYSVALNDDDNAYIVQDYYKNFDAYLKATELETSVDKVGIVLLCDIDLGGANISWQGHSNQGVYLEIDGGGHTIYNGYYKSNMYFLGEYIDISDTFDGEKKSAKQFLGSYNFSIHDVTFSNVYLTRSQGMFGSGIKCAYFENVDWKNCLVESASSCNTVAIGSNYTQCYFKNCNIDNSYIKDKSTGSAPGHAGFFASYNQTSDNKIVGTYIDSGKNNNNGYYYTSVSTLEETEIAWYNYANYKDTSIWKKSNEHPDKKLAAFYPSIYENCSVTNSNLYEMNAKTYHSGIFVSCMRGDIIFKNCYTNGSIYGYQQIGGFIGGVIGDAAGFTYPDPDGGEDTTVDTYFENCYSTGTVEGTKKLGGFAGMVFNDGRATGDNYLDTPASGSPSSSRGIVIFKNCYSTSSVGMEYSGSELGGFVGVLRGNVKGTGTKNKMHRFINCYAAGEVGGIGTNNSTDDINTNSIGGFIGVMRLLDYYSKAADCNKEYTEARENKKTIATLDGMMTNCYYDKQTTAMRERGIGSYKQSDYTTADVSTALDNYNHCDVIPGLTGVYTQKSDIQNVKGLTDNVSFEGSDAWVYNQGYYPQLAVFYNAGGSDFGSAEKAEKANLYSRASTATVFLEHWDEIMDGTTGKMISKGAANVYDTVRDISAKFKFTSDGNSAEGNLGWQLNEQRNEASDFKTYLGNVPGEEVVVNNFQGDAVEDTSQEDDDTEADVEYSTEVVSVDSFEVPFKFNTEDDGTGEEITIKYTPKVLQIAADEEENGKYTFNCFDYAAGKQFVKVMTCSEKDYENWLEDQKKYDDYVIDEAQYEVERSILIEEIGGQSNIDDSNINVQVRDEITKHVKGILDTDTNRAVWRKARKAYNTAYSYCNGNITDRAAVMDAIVFDEDDNVSDATDEITFKARVQEKYKAIAKYVDVSAESYASRTKFPISVPINYAKHDPEDFEHYMQDSYGTRTFRLIPQSYLNAGDMIKVNVLQDTTDKDAKPTNTVSLVTDDGEKSLDRFDHTIGVVYVSTQGMPLWMGDYDENSPTLKSRLADKDNYSGQVVDERDSYLTGDGNFFNYEEMEKASYFALYSYYPSYIGNGVNEAFTVRSGLDGNLINKRSIGSFYPNGYHEDVTDPDEYMGKTKVEVYEADGPTDDTVKSFTLTKKAKPIEMTEETLAKWSGEKPFDVNDKGYYYMTYYWRLNDGRYRSEDKLVVIETNNYNVTMRTGVADDVTDSFARNEQPTRTNIDCDIVFDENVNLKDYQFPSDRYVNEYDTDNPTNWDEYANTEYNDMYGETLVYPEVDGVNYWAKGVTQITGDGNVTVAWRKNADYHLDKLIVQIHKSNSDDGWQDMAIVRFDSAGKATIENNSKIAYSYSYTSYSVKQNARTKEFSMIRTDNTVREFDVDNLSVEDAVVQSINFNFTDSAVGQSLVQLSDDIRVEALFSKVAASVDVEKYVLIDNNKDEVNRVKGTNLSLSNVDSYRSVDNAKYDEDEQRAVLFGDTLIYRMKVQNTGFYNASNVIVTDTVPEGCTFVPNSVTIYRQKKVYGDSPSQSAYYDLDDLSATSMKLTDEVLNSYVDNRYIYDWDSDNNKLTFMLNPVNREYDYYIQYKAVVDANYQEKSKDVTNVADYTYSYINGGSVDKTVDTSGSDSDTEDNGTYNEYYPKNAVFNVTSNDSGDKYTLNFTGQATDVNQYIIDNITDRLPEGYVLDGEVTIDGRTDGFKIIYSDDKTSFTIEPEGDKLTFNNGDNLRVEFSIKQKDGATLSEKRSNYATITYKKNDNDETIEQNAITKVDASTNTVESTARWLYLDVEKVIPEEDSTQAFLFKLVNNSINKTVFTDVYANTKSEQTVTDVDNTDEDSSVVDDTDKDTSNADTSNEGNANEDSSNEDSSNELKTSVVYKGDNLIQITKRGAYTLSETDWANTDYEVKDAKYDFTDISFEDDTLKNGEATNSSTGVSFNLPRAMYESTAFPLWAAEVNKDNGSTDIVYPTVTCTNTLSRFAYFTSQQNVTNSFDIGNDVTDTPAQSAARRNVPQDTSTSPQAVLNTAVLELKKEDEDE